MNLLIQILCWASIFCILHSYVFYPLIIRFLAQNRPANQLVYEPIMTAELPPIVVVMAAYNEEKVIGQKLESLFQTTYPLSLIKVLIGSDNSVDGTNAIIEKYQKKYPQNLHFQLFGGRNGKIKIVNQLLAAHQKQIAESPDTILVMTDANVFFVENTIYQLVKHFKNAQIGLVAANILNITAKNTATGIAFQEKWYIQRENHIKYHEGLLYGNMMGAFGACYAMRANLFEPVPANFIVDDFYSSMKVLEKNKWAIKEPSAICYEDVSTNILEEFSRKKRISAGNFQNLMTFKHLAFPFFSTKNNIPNPKRFVLAFHFISHKILRWLGPFFLINIIISLSLLANTNLFYALLLSLQMIALVMPIADYILQRFGIYVKLFRFVKYFYLMNIALLIGFFNYLKGINNNVWKPTQRNQ